MASSPEFFLSTVIPAPALADLQPLASVSTDSGSLAVYWWDLRRSVVVYVSMYNLWVLQEDLVIRKSLADILDWPESCVHAENCMLFNDAHYTHGIELPEKLAELFLDCEWSDYACDRRPVSVCVTKKAPAPLPPVASTRVIFPPFRASRWSAAEDSSSEDEEPVTQPEPQRRRHYSLK